MKSSVIPRNAVLFIFNHDAAHQLAHTAGIMRALVMRSPHVKVACAFGNVGIRQSLLDAVGHQAAESIHWYDLSLPQILDPLVRAANMLLPAGRLARLAFHARYLRTAAMIVSPERTCLYLKRKWKSAHPLFVFVPHGAGDRSVTYHPSMAGFDHMLVSGRKVADEMCRHGLAKAENIDIIGYPKFDLIDTRIRPKFFQDERPVFVYNPHFDPHLSSWYDFGPDLLDWFASGDGRNFNLVFAPHVMLFRKKLHISLEYGVARRRPDLNPDWTNAPNILIDVASPRLFDMSYTLAADAYIGDVSSQVYEFLVRPRPCLFIDAASKQANNSNTSCYMFWQAGEVVRCKRELERTIPAMVDSWPRYREAQRAIFDYTISNDSLPSSERGATAINRLMNKMDYLSIPAL